MTDIVERLLVCAKYDHDQAEAADEITRLRNELHIAEVWSARVIAGTQQDVIEITRLRAEVEKLRAALWDVHAIANNGPLIWSKRIKATARAALEGK